jgi:alkylation response protein AidB-like acyl-CoA dehydrogenase
MRWDAEEEAFRHELRDWLKAETPAEESLGPPGSPAWFDGLRSWEGKIRDAGYNALAWPAEYGGAGAGPLRAAIFADEYVRAGAPQRLNYSAMSLLGPTLMAAGTPEQKAYWLPRILSLEDVWCQGFSEPEAGSDLASLRTRAVRDGDNYIVNGQKIWSSNGPYADHAFCLVRTDPSAPRHRGISYLLISLRQPGVEVRPIKQADGRQHFAEIFFNDAVAPVSNRIGEENTGWYVAMETLRFERAGSTPVILEANLKRVTTFLKETGRLNNADYRLRLAQAAMAVERYKIHYYALASSDRAETQRTLGPLSKVLSTETNLQVLQLGMDALGPDAEFVQDTLPTGGGGHFYHDYWYARAAMIFAGTNQIQRDIIARRVLGLPREAAK